MDTITSSTLPAFQITKDHTGHDGHGYESHGVSTSHYFESVLNQVQHAGDHYAGLLNAVNQSRFDTSIGVEKTAAAINLAIEKTAAATNLGFEKTTAATNLAIEKTAAANLLAMEKSSSSAAAALAACCCEMKELVREESCRTRDLINTSAMHDLQRQLSDAKLAIQLERSRVAAPIHD